MEPRGEENCEPIATANQMLIVLQSLLACCELTDSLLVHYKAAHNALVAASQGEAVPSEDDAEGLCGM